MPYPDYLVGEFLHPGSDLRIVDSENKEAADGEQATPISQGGTGVVYKAVQGGLIDRAVKILKPAEDVLATQEWSAFTASFEKEK